jgi:hypothetical protein
MKTSSRKKQKMLDIFNEKYRKQTVNLLRACREDSNLLSSKGKGKGAVITGRFNLKLDNFQL